MIESKYLCDYTIHIPIFDDDPTNKNICEHLLKNYKNIIIYCNSQKEGKELNILMNKLQSNSSQYIDCNTSKKKRESIIEKYKNGEMPFLVNVRILVEGFDAPITKGVCFLHLPSNKTTLIQIIGRCLRLHPSKTIANIILPFSSDNDKDNICNFMKVIAKNDSRIKQSFENKQIGGYISIENTNEDHDNCEEDENIEFKYNMIYNSIGILQNGEEIWMKKLEEVKKYIDENSKTPPQHDKNNIVAKLGTWINIQKQNYKQKKFNMKNKEIYNIWTEFTNDSKYKQYFISNEECWNESLSQVKKYIDENSKTPSQHDKDKNIKQLGYWIINQKTKYKNKKQIMCNQEICNKWTEFLNDPKYKQYLMSYQEIWNKLFNEVKNYIDKYNKRPSSSDKDKNIKQLGSWISHQQKNYEKKERIMKNKEIYDIWTDFINDNKYKEYFMSNEETWIKKTEEIKEYMNKNNKRPSQNDKDKKIKNLGKWISDQQINYKNKENIMKNEEIYNTWTKIINDSKYKKYLMTYQEMWNESLNEVKKYIDENNKRPSSEDNKNKNIRQLGNWILDQQKSYKKKENIMKNEEIYNKWTEFINDPKYKQYLMSNEESWNESLSQVKKYIDENSKIPSQHDKDKNIKQLGSWISNQKLNYKNKNKIMKNEEIYNKWTEFINDNKYKQYFK